MIKRLKIRSVPFFIYLFSLVGTLSEFCPCPDSGFCLLDKDYEYEGLFWT